ncbi:MAG: hypothetical protein MI754_08085 [Chromatiales bacterium]|nr:hypothetical protein [Chromatiales bacterium]
MTDSEENISRPPRRTGQKISLIIGFISYFAAFITFLAALYKGYTIGTENPIFASLAASVVFFVGAGVVLHVIGAVSLPNLKIPKNDE